MRYLITVLLCSAVLIGCSRKSTMADDLQWHPSAITCPDDRWTPQNGYILQRIELGEGREVCMPLVDADSRPAQPAERFRESKAKLHRLITRYVDPDCISGRLQFFLAKDGELRGAELICMDGKKAQFHGYPEEVYGKSRKEKDK